MAATKVQLRKYMSTILNQLSESDKCEQSRLVFEKLIEHPKYKQAKRLSLYLSTKNEIDTLPLLRHALEVDKKRCFVPLITTSSALARNGVRNEIGSRMLMVELKSMREYDRLPVNKYGIKEPPESELARLDQAKLGELDLIIVPGVAFASDGRRLGHGKGYYDEYLIEWSKRSLSSGGGVEPIYAIGLAFRRQFVDDPLAVEGRDFKLNEVISPPSSLLIHGEEVSR